MYVCKCHLAWCLHNKSYDLFALQRVNIIYTAIIDVFRQTLFILMVIILCIDVIISVIKLNTVNIIMS